MELREIYDSEVDRLGESFSTKHFMDTVLRTGPVPSDELAIVLKQTPPPVAIAD